MTNKLKQILSDCKQYHHTKSELDEIYVKDRLDKSLQSYYKELTAGVGYLSRRDPKNVIKKM